MRSPASAAEARALLESAHLSPSRRRGQNFLVDARKLDLVAGAIDINSADVVLEVGTGLGSLTHRLADRAATVITVELDHGLAALSRRLLHDRPNVVFVGGDALARSRAPGRPRLAAHVEDALSNAISRAKGRSFVVSNLPYSSASPLLLAFLDRDDPFEGIAVLVQKEVAARLVASPASRDYGMLGACARYFASATSLSHIGPRAFWPSPQVESTLVLLVPGEGVGGSREAYPRFRAVSAALFQGRRKRAATALHRLFGGQVGEVLAACGIPLETRADAIAPESIRRLADHFAACGGEKRIGE